MTTKLMRKIIKIDEEKCTGCGLCIRACAEGALQMINGKAKLISETYCDGLGACIGKCPHDAISVAEAETEEFDEEAVKLHLTRMKAQEEKLPCGCPSAHVQEFEKLETLACECETHQPSVLSHWPVQLALVPPRAHFCEGADLLLTADCVPFAYAGFHADFLKGHTLLVACPKLDNFHAHLAKLTEILRNTNPKSLTVVHMEVPCCSGLVHMAKLAIQQSGKDIPLQEITIGIKGDLKS